MAKPQKNQEISPDDRMDVSPRKLKAARLEAGLKQEELGKACGVGKAAYGFWESENEGRRTRPKRKQLEIVAEMTDKPISYFLTGSTEVHGSWDVDVTTEHQSKDSMMLELFDVARPLSARATHQILEMAKFLKSLEDRV